MEFINIIFLCLAYALSRFHLKFVTCGLLVKCCLNFLDAFLGSSAFKIPDATAIPFIPKGKSEKMLSRVIPPAA